MPYTEEEGGLLNNFAKEPRMYRDEAQSNSRGLLIVGILSGVLVVGLIAVSFILKS